MRLDKLLADAGFGSRRDAAGMIRQGRVRVTGQAPGTVAPQLNVMPQQVLVDGKPVDYEPELYLMLYKPKNCITALKDQSAPTIAPFLPELYLKRKASPVGRLDKDVTGLLIVTTDGELSHRLTSPRWGVEKRYLAKVDGVLQESDVRAFAQGLFLGDFTAKPAQLEIVRPDTALVVVQEGKFHQVKRMFESRGKPVTDLKRLSMGGVELDERLQPGQTRPLTAQEVRLLKEKTGLV